MTVLSVWSTIGSIALFIIALSVLVVIHEFGHFIIAKSFKVYCSDFSIGFGPKIIKIKRKKGETTFNVGIIPLGGYVSMFGEGVELPDGKQIPKSRSLNGINRWKRAAIMVAGIVMNFVLAFVIFFISASCFEQHRFYIDAPVVKNEEKYNSALRVVDPTTNVPFAFNKGDAILMGSYAVEVGDQTYAFNNLLQFCADEESKENRSFITATAKATVNVDGVDTEKYYVFGFQFQTPAQASDFSKGIVVFEATKYPGNVVKYPVFDAKLNKNVLVPIGKDVYLPVLKDGKPIIVDFAKENPTFTPTINILRSNKTEENPDAKATLHEANLKIEAEDGKIAPLYIGALDYTYWNGWKSFEVAGKQFAHSTTAVAKALGGLFVGKNLDQIGGPLAIFNQSTMILNEFPFTEYLNVWGVISVNLALFNLLPFPGLDGWQLLVTGVEGTVNVFTRSKYRKKYQKEKAKKANKPETEVVETPVEGKYDAALLHQLHELNENILDVEKAYFYKFNKKYNHEALLNTFSDPTMEEEYNANEEYKYFKDHNEAVHTYEEFVLLNNLSEVAPYKEWAIPETTKNIISYVGLGLLMLLAVVIFVMDIVKMF